jgi:hypothetical protein
VYLTSKQRHEVQCSAGCGYRAQIDLDRNVQQVYHWLKHSDELHFRIAFWNLR